MRTETAEARAKRLEDQRQRARRYREADPEGVRQYQANYHLQKKFGISLEDYEAMLAAQNFRCAICETDVPKGRGRWHVDHCHDTGRVRGLLCYGCNVGIGHLKDSPDVISRALTYLTKDHLQ
jgi:hypothetical protein